MRCESVWMMRDVATWNAFCELRKCDRDTTIGYTTLLIEDVVIKDLSQRNLAVDVSTEVRL